MRVRLNYHVIVHNDQKIVLTIVFAGLGWFWFLIDKKNGVVTCRLTKVLLFLSTYWLAFTREFRFAIPFYFTILGQTNLIFRSTDFFFNFQGRSVGKKAKKK